MRLEILSPDCLGCCNINNETNMFNKELTFRGTGGGQLVGETGGEKKGYQHSVTGLISLVGSGNHRSGYENDIPPRINSCHGYS